VKKKYLIILLLSIGLITLSGCQMIENWIKNAKEEWIGLEMTVRTYDENSQLIDQMSGKSLSISRNEEFDSVDAEGNSKEDSSVLKITLGKYEIDHVGSSLIAEEKGFSFPYLFDESQSVAKAYNAACTPDFYFFDDKLDLVYRGQMDDSRPGNQQEVTGEDLIIAFENLLAGQPQEELQKPSLGCNIKWKE